MPVAGYDVGKVMKVCELQLKFFEVEDVIKSLKSVRDSAHGRALIGGVVRARSTNVSRAWDFDN